MTGFEVVLNLVAFAFVGRLRTRQVQGRVSAVLNVLAVVIGLGLAAAAGQFDLYAAPVVMAVDVVGLVAVRLRFTHSVFVGVGYIVVFLAFAAARLSRCRCNCSSSPPLPSSARWVPTR